MNLKTILNSEGTTASPCLKPLVTLNSKDKWLPILTLTYSSLFKILHNLTYFFEKRSLSIPIFPFSIECHMLLQNQYIDVVLYIYVQNCTAKQKRVKVENINDTVLLFYAKDGNWYWSIILTCLLYFKNAIIRDGNPVNRTF